MICTPDKDLGQCVGGKVVQLDRRNRAAPSTPPACARSSASTRSRSPTTSRWSATAPTAFPVSRAGARSRPPRCSRHYGHIEAIPDDVREWEVDVRGAAEARRHARDRPATLALQFRVLATLRDRRRRSARSTTGSWRGPATGFEEWADAGSVRLAPARIAAPLHAARRDRRRISCMTLAGRIALVTGGGRGIGRAIVARRSRPTAPTVAVNYRRDEASARATVDDDHAPAAARRRVRGVDRRLRADERMVDAAIAELGPVDLLVNNAGVASRGLTVPTPTRSKPDRLWRTHVFGAWALAKLVIPGMRTTPRGDIVMISSAATLYMARELGAVQHGEGRARGTGLTLAKEERSHGIHVNVVAPGLVDTDMGRRLVKGAQGVDDIHTIDHRSRVRSRVLARRGRRRSVRLVVSDAASYVTGQRIGVDGGAW